MVVIMDDVVIESPPVMEESSAVDESVLDDVSDEVDAETESDVVIEESFGTVVFEGCALCDDCMAQLESIAIAVTESRDNSVALQESIGWTLALLVAILCAVTFGGLKK